MSTKPAERLKEPGMAANIERARGHLDAIDGDLKVGARVEWTSQSAGIVAVKRGVVERVVPAGERPPKLSKSPAPGAARDHVSYLVRVKGRGLYWPRVSHLRGWVEDPAGAGDAP